MQPTACSGACIGAIQVPPLPVSLVGDTSLTESGSDFFGACGISDDNKVEYYKLTGTGSCIMAEVESTDFRPKLVFYTGPCSDLECYHQSLINYVYEGDPRAPGYLREAKSTVFPTSDGVEYTIGVPGIEGNESGTYTLMLVRFFV